MRPYSLALALLLALGAAAPQSQAAPDATVISQQSKKAAGFLDFYYHNDGQLYLSPTRLKKPFLLLTSLPQGVGSNDIGLDRGQLGRTRLVQFERLGPDIILRELNSRYRADSDSAPERRAVREAFAESVLWRAALVPGKQPLVPLNELLIQDLHGVADSLKAAGQGEFQLDKQRSLIIPEGVKSFERNSDVDVLLTFSSAKPGAYVAQVTPDPKSVSIRTRVSFIALPEAGYEPRDYLAYSGYLMDEYLDYGTAVDQSVVRRHILRHRLQKKVPGPAPSEVVKPIVYYLDPGVPEPIRSALLDGGRWWSEAFDAAGFIGGFKMELLPEDADPQDVRYNVVQWVHRASRGWSYGSAVADPRTGEIIKGHVTLGSLRVRQDHLIARGLTAGWDDRQAAADAAMGLSLARIRQLAAHEIGHTLGLEHNFAASSNDNSSVMDYPHPQIGIQAGQIDISQAYGTGVGAWDKFAIAYGYGDFGKGEAGRQALAELVRQAQSQGLRYIGEADSRRADASHAYASLWDNGSDPVAELNRLQQVRRLALDKFGPEALLPGDPQGELADALVPLYLLSRYQIEAAAKFIGGTDYSYQDRNGSWQYIAPELQRQALSAVLATLAPESLTLPRELTELLVPKAGSYGDTRESFARGTGVISDPLAMAEVLGRHSVHSLLWPRRLNRVAEAALNDREQLGIAELVDSLLAKTLYLDNPTGPERGPWLRVNAVVVDELLQALHSPDCSTEVRAQLAARLDDLQQQLKRRASRGSADLAAHYNFLAGAIGKGMDDSQYRLIPNPMAMPPGSPI
ncbi:zinc-dependent metalloprotease [Shewanella cyperi]|uniref:zinc-dependent metalloprotease n=1 Tax=Shewanella cyperi TaxID=2814292 RepID=UPI001A94767A|nr:zinc-dependent metalloprotease [Shewanella cyperi]QSX40352.1 zinc-dependent metalloprotease [Shewanella cyperi]